MVTLGLRTFIIKPCLKRLPKLFFSTPFVSKAIVLSERYTFHAKYSRYNAPKILIPLNTAGLFLITAETPKANKLVCIKHPVMRPAMVAKPYFFPWTILCISTKILSGPGDRAKAIVAIENVRRIS